MKKITLILLVFVVGLNCLLAQDCKYKRCIKVFEVKDPKKFFDEVSKDTVNFVSFTDPASKSWGLEKPISKAKFKMSVKATGDTLVEVTVIGILYPSSFEFFWNFPDTANDLKTIVFDRNGFMTNFLWYKRNKNDNWIIDLSYYVEDPKQHDVDRVGNYVEEGKKFLFSFDVRLATEQERVRLRKAFPNMK